MKNAHVVNLREMMVTVVIAILCGIVFYFWAPLWNVVGSLFYNTGGELIYGMWFIAATLAAYIIQKPGVAIVAEMGAATMEALIGGQWGATTLVYGLMQGLAVELVFALGGYKRYNLFTLLIAGAMAAVGSFAVQWFYGDLAELETNILWLMIGLRVLSGAVLAGLLAKLIVDALKQTGVLNAYQVVRSGLNDPFQQQR